MKKQFDKLNEGWIFKKKNAKRTWCDKGYDLYFGNRRKYHFIAVTKPNVLLVPIFDYYYQVKTMINFV